MFFLVLRKIMNNKWLMASLLIGLILAVAMVSSIPLYTDGIMQRMLVKDLEQYQKDSGVYPGRYTVQLNAYTFYQGDDRIKAFNWFDSNVDAHSVAKLGLPATKVKRIGMDYMTFLPPEEAKPTKIYSELYGITDYEQHVQIIAGRMPARTPVNGVYEVIAAEEAQSTMNVMLGEELTLTDETKQMAPTKIKIVGLYRRPATADAWWSEPEAKYSTAFLMDYNLMYNDIVEKNNAIVSAYWYYAIDYTKLKVDGLTPFIDSLTTQKKFFTQYAGISWDFPAQSILENYSIRADQLKITLWVLQIPILLMLAFYIFMVSQLIIENDRNEIAVIKSRGASGFQIFGSYLMQSVLLSGVAVIIGPPVGMFICRVLGASNGFLEFVSRTSLPLNMSMRTVQYAILAGCFSIIMMMIPAVQASCLTIVEHKQKKARRWNAPIWQKMFLDFILLGVSLYGLYQYNIRQKTVMVSSVAGMSVPVDPFLFIISTAFVIGAGLLFLRLYPYVIRFISWVGNRFMPPVAYSSLVQVGRSGGREQFLMLFLILTISIGIFNANSARTINQNIVDKESYKTGADITLQMNWPSNEIIPPTVMGPLSATDLALQEAAREQVVTYQEPDFAIYSKLAGTAAAARVFIPGTPVSIRQSDSPKAGMLMAIVPNEFGKVVWSTPSLLPYNINAYLNLLARSPNAVLVSQQLMQDLGLKVGDPITYQWGKQDEVDGVVYGVVKYWPTLNPYVDGSKYFVIANLNYVQALTSMEPYQIWYKRAPGATTKQIYDDIAAKKMNIISLANTEQEIVALKNDPILQGTNGAMTLGFIVTLAISMIGFFIYWLLSIQSRTLQFGIFRAMGMSAGRVILMLMFEQIMISGAAIFMGIIIGGVMSQLFVPLLGLVYGAADQVPTFTVIASRADYYRLYAVVGAMLAVGLAMLGVMVKRIKVSQAIKLGED